MDALYNSTSPPFFVRYNTEICKEKRKVMIGPNGLWEKITMAVVVIADFSFFLLYCEPRAPANP